ncbi:uncharacterized protein LOC108679324 [Hyalella azteca]|uniref:Uncharacterized protein LOC108679324 n=1 Tax=Hyalella azteca TaxID=294128 RepID=A0A979FJJ1_HYAAZ|nr:uncharacterized protein LOC108679324 [Hyalella azteca]
MGGAHSKDAPNNQDSGAKDADSDRASASEGKNVKKFDREEILGQKPDDLTDQEKTLIRDTWQDVETSVARVGVVMLSWLFETHPDVQESFMSFRGVPLPEVQQSKQLRNHALRVQGHGVQGHGVQGHGVQGHGVQGHGVQLIGPQFIAAMQGSLQRRWEACVEEAWLRLFRCLSFSMKAAMLDLTGD